jgi:hypothetical protein
VRLHRHGARAALAGDALSLGGLRRRIEVLLLPDDVDVVLDRLQTAAQKIDALFGAGYAAAHPEVLVVVVQSAASDWAAARLAAAIEHVAIALAEPEQHIVPARELLRPRP